MSEVLLKTISPEEVVLNRRDPVDLKTMEIARGIVDDIRARGESALRAHAARLGDIADEASPLVYPKEALAQALEALDEADRALLERVALRITRFARAQKESLAPFEIAIPGGRAGQVVSPVERAGCYAPGGRFPLPSSVLMTAVTARAAGVAEVWVASPRPVPITLAAAAVAGADGLLCVGGAQGIAALAFGIGPVPACDVVVGPGNRFVTAAKQILFGRVGIDMLAGPSELTVLADETADPDIVAADLLAQAEHDPDAVPILVTTDTAMIAKVNEALAEQLKDLNTGETARVALKNGFAVCASDIEQAVAICDRIAPEHLELHITSAEKVGKKCRHYGALFLGTGSAEVLGDYGAGPNHTLPTGGTPRHSGGLSVLSFLRVRTTLIVDDPAQAAVLLSDAEKLAKLEGLTAHSRAARIRAQAIQGLKGLKGPKGPKGQAG